MKRSRVKYSAEFRAIDMYHVLLKKERTSRSYIKAEIINDLTNPDVYVDFLKICIEEDESDDLRLLKRGLNLIVEAFGYAQVAREMGVARLTLYRMLAENGNPELKTLLKLFKCLGIRFWVVEDEFMERMRGNIRYKNVSAPVIEGRARRIKPKPRAD